MSLPKPTKIWWNGSVVPWEEASVHVTAETSMRGVNVFEGVMAYRLDAPGQHAVIDLDAHLERLARSAALLHLPVPFSPDELREGVRDLIRAEPSDQDLYLRPTIFLESGGYTADPRQMRVGCYITSYTRERASLRSVSLVSSPLTRLDDPYFPAQAKSGAVYSAFRLARIAAASAGGDEPLLLNARGTVAETAGAAVMAVFADAVVSPPPDDGALDSITRAALADILEADLGRKVVQRSLHPDELHSAEEVFLCGTLDEVAEVTNFDGRPVGRGGSGLTRDLFDRYRARCTDSGAQPPALQTRVSW